MTEYIFAIDDLSHQFVDGTLALKNLSLRITKGKKIALLGNNGAGKSTLFKHLNGLLKPTSGSIYYKGQKVKYNRNSLLSLRKDIGIVFQDPDSQLISANVQQDISFGPLNLGYSKEEVFQKVEWAMEKTEITELKNKPTHFLSLGQKKRVAIAGILAMDPEVWILDEPTAGLDPYYSKQIMNLLESIQQSEKTFILSTHDVNLAYAWAEEIIVMSNGGIIYHGDPVTIFNRDDLLWQAHLEKPLIFETFQLLSSEAIISKETKPPRNKDELFQQVVNQCL